VIKKFVLSTNFEKSEFQCIFSDFLDFVLQIQTYSSKLGKNFAVLSAKTKLYKNVSLTAQTPVKITCFEALSNTQISLFQKGNLH